METENTTTARIFEDVGGYYICDDDLDYLDTRGYPSRTKAEAMRVAKDSGYTHARGSGTYKGNNLTKL